MFGPLLKKNFIKELLEEADIYITLDKLSYKNIYDYMIEMISQLSIDPDSNKPNLLISDINLLAGKHIYFENVQMYCNKSYIFTQKLMHKMCENFGSNFFMNGNNYEDSYYIIYDGRKICTITSFKIYKSYSVNDFIEPVEFIYNGCKIFLLSPIIELIRLYGDLYNPDKVAKWGSILESIKSIELLFDKDIKKLLIEKEIDFLTISPSLIGSNENKKVDEIKKLVMDFLVDSEYLLIDTDDIQIITKNDIIQDIGLINNYVQKFMSVTLVYKEKTMYNLTEHLMKKYSIYANNKKIMTIYNNLSYGLICFGHIYIDDKEYRIADPIALIRFLYIDVWDLIISRKINETKFNILVKKKLAKIEALKNQIDIRKKKIYIEGYFSNVESSLKLLRINNPNSNRTDLYCYQLNH